ncbi:hypothetical protein PVNG_05970 [Plasmodium vivax North Korean]|uniref:VIR protein n=1 Tax=Plasmodium vivax North Korean TaxID=1035514 RepID=A0A0J9U0P7_PLAVI|nr:hypothetical protein PVNG_05970 [Plasmodium vivax North Korean]
MTANETNDTYFNYKDYDTIRGKFLTNLERNKDYDTQFFKKALIELKDESKREISFRNIFIELQKHLNQFGILAYEAPHRGCKYINYVLNKDMIEGNLNIPNETAFNLFKDFEYKFRKYKGSAKPICDLHYINDDIYKKMKSLYGLYDEFISLKQKYNSTPNCDKFPSFVHQFNDFVRNIKDNESDFFKNKLKNFIEEIKKHPWTTNKVCDDRLSKIASLKPDPSVEREVLSSHIPASTFQSASISSSDSRSVIVGESLHHTNGLESPEEQSPREKEQVAETLPHTGSLQYTERQDNSGILQHREVQKSTDFMSTNRPKSTLEAKPPQQEEYTRNEFPFKRQHYPDAPVHHDVLGSQNIENETSVDKGYLRKVTDAVSGFMEGVDPVPVVGVSEEEDTDNESLQDSMEYIQDL